MDVVELIQTRNRCLSKIHHISLNYLAAEVPERAEQALQVFESFQRERDACCRVLELLDRKITESAQVLSSQKRNPTQIKSIEALSANGEKTIGEILKTDQKIFERVDLIKSKVQQEIVLSKKGQQVVGRFKSLWVQEPGSSWDGSA